MTPMRARTITAWPGSANTPTTSTRATMAWTARLATSCADGMPASGTDTCVPGDVCSPVTGQCEVQVTTLAFQEGVDGYSGHP